MIDATGSSNADDLARRRRLRAMISAAQKAAAEVCSSTGDGLRVGSPTGLPPKLITGYELQGELHRGGQGVVYRGIQESTKRVVAIKVLKEGPFAGETDRLRFEREVSILAQLNHRNIIGILDRGSAAGSHYLVMDYIDGRPLDRYVRERGLDLPGRLRLFGAVCDAVSAAHLRGVIHRDLKPTNILVDGTGDPRILDFGLAKMTGPDSDPAVHATQTGQFLGSLPWASPEQARGRHAEVDVRSDVYSLGVVLYQLVTGQFPYETMGEPGRVLSAIENSEPASPRSLTREVNDDLETIMLKALAKEPSRRYQSVGELARDVRHYLDDEPIEAKRDSGWYVLLKTLRRYRVRAAVAASFVLLIAASAVALGILYSRSLVEAEKSRQIADFAKGILSGIDPATAGDKDKRLMRQVLDDAAARVDSELVGNPEAEAAIRHTIGKAYQAIGDNAPAKANLEKSVELRRQVLGSEHVETLAAMDDLAMFFNENANLPEAERLCRQVLETRKIVLGPLHIDTLLSMSNAAEILRQLGRYEEAARSDRQTLELRMRILGAEHPHTTTSMNNLAGNLASLQKYDEAEALFLKTIEVEKRVKGELHPHTLRTMSNLGLMYQEALRMDDAEKWHRETLAKRQRVFGEEHLDTFDSAVNLAIVLRAKGQVEEAEAMLRRQAELERRVLGDKHPSLGSTLFVVASIVARRGDFAQAEKLLNETLAIYGASMPADHWKALTSRIALGTCIARMGRFQEAERLLLEGNAAIHGRPEAIQVWREAPPRFLIALYEDWDKAEPETGKAEEAAKWRAVLASLQPSSQPASRPETH